MMDVQTTLPLGPAARTAVDTLDQLNRAREMALSVSRSLVRQAAHTIRALHRREWDEAERLAGLASASVGALREQLRPYPGLFHAGYVQDAFKEFVEARLLQAMVRNQSLPTNEDLEVEPAAYLNGMAEAASELRRYLLDALRSGVVLADRPEYERLLAVMDEVYTLLVTVDYPDAVTGGLRRSTDALRAVLERTRGDLTLSIQQAQLLAAMNAAR
ncbi:MAG: haloacid dehalogenase [Herpetosiphon sp.]